MSRLRDNPWVLPASLVVALLLGLLPLPALLQPLRPYWLALVLAYWVIEAPERVGLGVAFASGVIADLLYGGVLGEQALRLVMLAFILQRFRARIRFFPMSQQMLAIGRALMAKPRLLLLDEPSMGLAPIVVQEIFRSLRAINADGLTLFLVEQNVRQALKIAQNGYVLENGAMALTGTGRELLGHPRVLEAYLGA
ncbi:hypothetical protein G6F59_012757 [Rhizopus arrhizus]|nr:hypothetical protein G6F59_012757 [Rhizopus arrhizus]